MQEEGGGAYSSGTCGGQPGKGGNDGPKGSDGNGDGGGKGGSNGDGGQEGASNGFRGSGGGGGYKGNGNGARTRGDAGLHIGGLGGLYAQNGGFGYGAGGGGNEGGGGGGGYSGGGGGVHYSSGGGGGSFTSSVAAYSSITKGGTVRSPQDGFITYVFKDITLDKPVAVCKDITVHLGANGTVSIPADSSDGGSINPLSGPLTFFYFGGLSGAPILNAGCHSVKDNLLYLVVQNSSSFDYCTTIITVEDTTPPVAYCQDITVALDHTNTATITEAQIDNGSSDVCGIAALFLDKTEFACWEAGIHTVTLSVEDDNENLSDCIATVTVTSTPPVAVCNDVTLSLPGATMLPGAPVLPGATVSVAHAVLTAGSTDNCGLEVNTQTFDFDCSDIGQNSVTVSVKENIGNASTSCTAIVTVVEAIPPTALCQSTTVALNASGLATVIATDVDNASFDNCSAVLSFSTSPHSFDCSAVGNLPTVTLTATDGSGNSAACTASIAIVDHIKPMLTCPSNQQLAAGNSCMASYALPTPLSDNCTGATWGASFSGNLKGLPSTFSGITEGASSGALKF